MEGISLSAKKKTLKRAKKNGITCQVSTFEEKGEKNSQPI